MAFRMIVDRLKCENNGRCIKAASGLIQPGHDDGPVIVQARFDTGQEAVMLSAVAACPMQALSIVEVADT